jgi:hypothetical protein
LVTPFPSVTVTEYSPGARPEIVSPDAPLLHVMVRGGCPPVILTDSAAEGAGFLQSGGVLMSTLTVIASSHWMR